MSEKQIELEIRQDTVWRRPTWPLGANTAATKRKFERAWHMHGFGFQDDLEGHENGRSADRPQDTPEQKALRCLELVPPVSLTRLKARYKELVKQLHPDANGGDRSAEEQLKTVNDAYTTLKRFLTA